MNFYPYLFTACLNWATPATATTLRTTSKTGEAPSLLAVSVVTRPLHASTSDPNFKFAHVKHTELRVRVRFTGLRVHLPKQSVQDPVTIFRQHPCRKCHVSQPSYRVLYSEYQRSPIYLVRTRLQGQSYFPGDLHSSANLLPTTSCGTWRHFEDPRQLIYQRRCVGRHKVNRVSWVLPWHRKIYVLTPNIRALEKVIHHVEQFELE